LISDIVSAIESHPLHLGFSGVDESLFRSYATRVGGSVLVPPGSPKVSFLTSLAASGSGAAAFFLGCHYEFGDGVPGDSSRALEWYRLSADRGSPYGSLRAGELFAGSDAATSVRYLRSSAAAGNAEALNALGELTESGRAAGGAPAAVALYGRSAVLGSAAGRANYGRCLAGGVGVGANAALAARIRGAGSADEALARGLALVAEGADERASAELRAAAACGSGDALFALGWLADAARLRADPDELYRAAADCGSLRAKNSLGVRLVRAGRKDEGYALIASAAWAGDADAMNNIAAAIESGDCEGDIRMVPGLYRDAAAARENYAEAQTFLQRGKPRRNPS
jgi:TPR repeat protein